MLVLIPQPALPAQLAWALPAHAAAAVLQTVELQILKLINTAQRSGQQQKQKHLEMQIAASKRKLLSENELNVNFSGVKLKERIFFHPHSPMPPLF